jgi:hypothetical protein
VRLQSQALQANRIVLKDLRSKRYDTAFTALLAALNEIPGYPKHPLEHPALTSLFQDLVQKGDFDASERHIENIVELDLGARHMRGLDSIQITPIELTGSEEPPWRQFFALVNDGNELYLFGGCESVAVRWRLTGFSSMFASLQSATATFWMISGEPSS